MKTKENIRKTVKNKENNNIFYKSNPCGISLIVLVITIIVIIILAAAVILTLNKNNPINEANNARYESDVANMQAIFTNTVAKIMAEKGQNMISITSGKLNSVTSGEKSVEGNAIYTLSDGTTGQIIFNQDKNKENEYYTGIKLPLYNKKTTWYVDEQGIISVEIENKKYGDGNIVKSIKISTQVVPIEEFITSKVKVKIDIDFEGEIESIKFGGNDINVPQKQNGKYITEIEVTENGEYEVEAIGKDGSKNKVTLKITQIQKDERTTIAYSENPTMKSNSFLTTYDFRERPYGIKITKVKFALADKVSENSIKEWDISKDQNKSVMAWIEDDGNSGYELTIAGKEKIMLPTFTGYFFYGMYNVRSIENIELLDTSNTTNMEGLFFGLHEVTDMDLNNFDISNVNNAYRMFYQCKKLTATINITNNIENYSNMFSDAAIVSPAKITLNYTSETSSLVDKIIASKPENSNIVKGVQI